MRAEDGIYFKRAGEWLKIVHRCIQARDKKVVEGYFGRTSSSLKCSPINPGSLKKYEHFLQFLFSDNLYKVKTAVWLEVFTFSFFCLFGFSIF